MGKGTDQRECLPLHFEPLLNRTIESVKGILPVVSLCLLQLLQLSCFLLFEPNTATSHSSREKEEGVCQMHSTKAMR